MPLAFLKLIFGTDAISLETNRNTWKIALGIKNLKPSIINDLDQGSQTQSVSRAALPLAFLKLIFGTDAISSEINRLRKRMLTWKIALHIKSRLKT